MAARKTASSPKPDKLIRDALLIELQRDSDQIEHGKKIKRLRLVARKMVDEALDGNVVAMKEIADRIDGRPAQSVAVEGNSHKPIEHKLTVEFVSTSRE